MTTTDAFDGLAADYDRAFTQTRIGRWMREATWRRCDALFPAGARVLEINCGTGEDAVHLGRRGVRVVATDASPAMVTVARRKVEDAGLESVVEVALRPIEAIGDDLGAFDGVLSNFGGLNCVGDLAAVATRLAGVLRPGGRALLCVMGPRVPWEFAWFAIRGDLARARRRRRGGVTWRGMTIHYYAAADVRAAFAPGFRVTRTWALGAVMPPPFAEAWAVTHPRLSAGLARLERRLETAWPLPSLADHVVVELERRPA
ncbi:methyltransferase [Luteitalea sp. TBR-22]|uniref:class I SAM-dependent methyltransferase n=1 Tax=Luteitalea sp. TBR-22 TaxID=2802971 RepID=UPI001AF3FC7F|nr:class I SAM-dependent methyltransferase [Luteitalea sp. TBR-22]BCS31748.1 methyltransferase [Luteitalea sp. TBR-22]